MDKNLYEIMQEILKEKGSNKSDIKYLGAIYTEENDVNGKVKVGKDIFVLIDVMPDGSLIKKYYDENKNFLAGRSSDGELFPSREFSNEDIGFLSEIDSIDETQGISLNEIDNNLEKISKKLGISKSDIFSMSEVELDQIIKESSIGLTLSDDESFLSKEERKKQNEIALDNINSKQEINLDKKVDNRYSLAEILGASAGAKLVVVDSDQIQDTTNTTRFSCIIKEADGSIKSADMLQQVGGKYSDKNIYETNRDGSVIENKVIQSSYAIDSDLIKNGILTVRIGQMGSIEVGYGQMDKTSHKDAFTQRLETRELYPVTSRVREEFSKSKGIDNIPDKIDEIKEHEKHGCKSLSLNEADGNPNTGHIHSEDVVELILSDKDVGEKINDIYTENEIKERFESMREKHPDKDFDDLIAITKYDLSNEADHMHGRDRSF